MKKVATIMSTYNGERYLQEQIDSILTQKGVDDIIFEIYIRDDGSKDKTKKIIEKNCKAHKNVFFVNQEIENLGVQGSFFYLLRKVEADYYFLSDQDDIWFPEKVHDFLNEFKALDNTLPGGVYSDLLLVDSKGNSLGSSMMETHNWNYEEKRDFANLLFKCRVTGAAFAINKAARDEVIKLNANDFSQVYMHDSFLAQLAAAYDNLAFIPRKLVAYRQHGDNVVGAENNNYPFWKLESRKKRYEVKFKDAFLLQQLLFQDSDGVALEVRKVLLKVHCYSQTKSRFAKIRLILDDYKIIWNRFRPIQLLFLMFLY